MIKKKSRELTAAERREIRRLVSGCANYDDEYGCLILEGDCYMLNKWWTGSLCRYFAERILPEHPILERALTGEPAPNTKPCTVCGKPFPVAGRKAYCSEACQKQGQRKKDAKRAKRYRQKGSSSVTN